MITLEASSFLALRAIRDLRAKSVSRYDPHEISLLLRRSRCDCGFSKACERGKYFLREKFRAILEKIVTVKMPFPMLPPPSAASPQAV
jgi:hypothetical protein